jgi:D-alanyl-D-alanine carboxypeptidase (penicillin-binding protein 5/6)
MRRTVPTIVALVFAALCLVVQPSASFAQADRGDFLTRASESAILIDGASSRILYQEKPDLALPPASITKVMTEYLVLDAVKSGRISWDLKTPVSDYVFRISQNRKLSNVPLRRDESYTVRELYESVTIYSANGSTIALAELIAGSEAEFIKMMDRKAAQLGLDSYKFVNSTGLNNADLLGMHPPSTGSREENSMSPRSVALLAYHAIRDHPEILKTSSVPRKVFREGTPDRIRMDNWNWMLPGLVYGYEGCDGLKTGSTDLGGYSFVATAKRNGMRFIAVVMKADSYAGRFNDTKRLLDYAFDNHKPRTVFSPGHTARLPVVNGKQRTVEVTTRRPLTVMVKSGDEKLVRPAYRLDPTISQNGALVAPVKKGQAVGYLTADFTGGAGFGYLVDVDREKVEIYAVETVKRESWLTVLLRGIWHYLTGLL